MLRRHRLTSLLAFVACVAATPILAAQAPAQAQSQTVAPAPKKAAAVAATPTAASPLNINTATVAQFETLPGIGPAVANRIIEFRQKNGGFKKIEELMNVKGIGEKSFLKIKPLITAALSKTIDK